MKYVAVQANVEEQLVTEASDQFSILSYTIFTPHSSSIFRHLLCDVLFV